MSAGSRDRRAIRARGEALHEALGAIALDRAVGARRELLQERPRLPTTCAATVVAALR